VTVTQVLLHRTCYTRPNKLFLFYSARMSFSSKHVAVILKDMIQDRINITILCFAADGRMPFSFMY
jgi:hypothetical protein